MTKYLNNAWSVSGRNEKPTVDAVLARRLLDQPVVFYRRHDPEALAR